MNPEDSVVDAIGKLVDASLEARHQDDHWADFYEKCPLCAREWHGLPEDIIQYGSLLACPGALATEEEAVEYRKKSPTPPKEPAPIITFRNPQDWWPLGHSR